MVSNTFAYREKSHGNSSELVVRHRINSTNERIYHNHNTY